MKFFEQCLIMLILFLFTYFNTWIFLEITWKYLENESGIWLATLCKLSLHSFILKTLKGFQSKCEACDLYFYTEMFSLYISFLTKM